MGARGELFTTEVYLDNRSYFFNVKENRTGDVFLQIVESKNRDSGDVDRRQIAVFANDLQQFLKALDKSLSFIEKDKSRRTKNKEVKKVTYKVKDTRIKNDGLKRTGKIHVVSKRIQQNEINNESSPVK